MLRTFRVRARSVSAALVAGFVALWLAGFASACEAATTPGCERGGPACVIDDLALVAAPCEAAAVSCEQAPVETPVTGHYNLLLVFAAVAIGFFDEATPDAGHVPPPDWRATRPPHTPLYLTHLALLN